MSIKITDECLCCDACIDECPTNALISSFEESSKDFAHTYVKSEMCTNCSDVSTPKCVDVCPSYSAILWENQPSLIVS
ncbi:MAG: 4Fe-4S dicluster domain-containing protein [Campylobacterota bacterium]|nr:4Fe-4S dicluster domain-containing protein [Campylobacterota bacterium]